MGDVVKYKIQLWKLISRARKEGLEVSIDEKLGLICFKSDNGECTSVEV